MEYCKNFKINQYENYCPDGLFPLGEKVNAKYIAQISPDHQGNPLIEALPPTYNTEQLLNILQRLPKFSEYEKNERIEHKIHAIKRLYNYHFVMPNSIEVSNKLSMIIKGGYESRNITTPDYIRRMNLLSDEINEEWVNKMLEEPICIYNYKYSSNPGTTIVGGSGNGKTNAINTALMTYPQSIVHTEYGGCKFKFTQLVWIKVNCAPEGELKDMCQKIFSQMDKALHTDYFETYGQSTRTKGYMANKLGKLFNRHALGVLVVDELQFLAGARVGSKEILKFFISLEGDYQIPIIYIGTSSIINKVFGSELYGVRKASGVGEIVYTNMENKGKRWNTFIENMWRYQWTEEYCPLDEEIKEMCYKKSAGIIDREIKLFMATQLYAIIHKKRKINTELMEKVANEHMVLTKHYIEKMHQVNNSKTKKYIDLPPEDIDELFRLAEKEAYNEKKLEELRGKDVYKEGIKKDEIINEVTYSLNRLGFEANVAEKVANSIVNQYGPDKGMDFIMQQVAKELKNINKPLQTVKKKLTDNKDKQINNQKKAEESIGYEKLKEEGKIKGIEEFQN